MAANYRIGDRIKEVYPHHASFKALWENKWKEPCANGGIYPFMYGSIEDFQPVVDELVSQDQKEPYDWNSYAQPFFPMADRLVAAAQKAEDEGQRDKAAECFLRASAVYRIARFPCPFSENQKLAYTKGVSSFLRGQSLLPTPIENVHIPYNRRRPHEAESIPALVLFPPSASPATPAPTVIVLSGLDSYRTDNAPSASAFHTAGVGAIVLDIPGTGDSPADPSDPESADRQMDSVLDWCADQPYIDSSKICVWGQSTGGFYATRCAHNNAERLLGVVSQGGGSHRMFEKAWLDEVNHLEYPFELSVALSHKFGYGSNVEKFKAEALSKFSLLHDGTLENPCTRLLLVNGTDDTIFPIDDMYLILETGPSIKEARFIKGSGHMGRPDGEPLIFNWIFELFGLQRVVGDVQNACGQLLMKTKYEL